MKTLQQTLLTAITAKDWGDVDLLIDTLRAIDPSATAPASPELAKLLQDEDERLVRLGCHALGLMGSPAAAAAPALAALLDPTRPRLAALAARALGRIGPAAREAAPSLTKVLSADDEALAFEASRALCRLAPSDEAIRAQAIDAVLAHPWYAIFNSSVPAGKSSGRSITLAHLGKDAVAQLLAKGQAFLENGAKVREKKEDQLKVDYTLLAELAGASFILDPGSAASWVSLLEQIPGGNPHQTRCDRPFVKQTIADLQGKLDQCFRMLPDSTKEEPKDREQKNNK